MPDSTYRLGVDIGGTFTDIVLVGDRGMFLSTKVLSTPDDFARGVLSGVAGLLSRQAIAPSAVAGVVHATTVATNALLQRRGARVGLITTAGFRDLLEIRRMRLPRLYDLTWEKPPSLVERALRLEVLERLDHTGAVVLPLDEDSARTAIETLHREDVEAVAVCLLHSYANATHELQVERLLRDGLPGVYLSLSCRVLPQIQEYERLSTTVINAFVGPVVSRYLDGMSGGLRHLGIDAPLLVMQSNGGCMTAGVATQRPAQLVESGPAAGAIAAAALARELGEPRLLSLDMGGTTAKATLILDGRVPLAADAEIGAGVTVSTRLNRGGGYVLNLPSVDLVEVGAGGGSLLWLDGGGVLQVGPQSAGADPGPACYGAGGTLPTLTDANVHLGYLNPRWLVGGALPLDAAAAHRVVDELARQAGLTVTDAAYGAYRVAIASMVRAVRAVSAERGHDPADAVLVAFGGNGPVHAVAVAEALRIPRVLVPPAPGVFSAYGLLTADIEHHFSRTHLQPLTALDPAAIGAVVQALRTDALATLSEEHCDEDAVRLEWAAELRYTGQSTELRVPISAVPALPGSDPTAAAIAGLATAFHAAHEQTYGHCDPTEPVELVHLRLVARAERPDERRAGMPGAPANSGSAGPFAVAAASGPPAIQIAQVAMSALGVSGAAGEAGTSATSSRAGVPGAPGLPDMPPTRRAYFGPAAGWLETPVVTRAALAGEAADQAAGGVASKGGRQGPLIVEEYDATTVVPPGWAASLDGSGCIILERLWAGA